MDINPANWHQDIRLSIFGWLDPQSLFRAGQVCKNWQKTANIESLWKSLCERQFGATQPLDCSWKSRFKLCDKLENARCTITSYETIPNELSLNQLFCLLGVKPCDRIVGFQYNKKDNLIQLDLMGTAEPIELKLDQPIKPLNDTQPNENNYRVAIVDNNSFLIIKNQKPSLLYSAIALTSNHLAIMDHYFIQIFEKKTGNFLKKIKLQPIRHYGRNIQLDFL